MALNDLITMKVNVKISLEDERILLNLAFSHLFKKRSHLILYLVKRPELIFC